ncbi:MAG: hypothetical protein AAF617_05020, partial [Bacteroidota bacterium]
NLSVKKSTISSLNKTFGGTAKNTIYIICGTGPESIRCTFRCTFTGCGTTFNSRDRCETIEVDKNTIPIC